MNTKEQAKIHTKKQTNNQKVGFYDQVLQPDIKKYFRLLSIQQFTELLFGLLKQ